MLRRSIAFTLFAIAGHTYSADITVTTLVDEDKNDSVCSLREAVFFLNNRTQQQYENGYHGCGNKESTSIITLESGKEYKLNSAIQIKSSLTVRTQPSINIEEKVPGLRSATISSASGRIFEIDDNNVEAANKIVQLVELNLKGTGTTTNVDNGGLIFNREALSIQFSVLSGGRAERGGAIYNAGILSSQTNTTAGTVAISNTILRNNKATQGGVIYSEMPLYIISQSILRDNEVASNGSLVYSQTAFDDETTGGYLNNRAIGFRNTTVFHNKGGFVANVRDGMIVNNVTMVKNAKGLYLDAPKQQASVSNSILVGNAENCSASATDRAIVQSNLVIADCNRNAPSERPNFILPVGEKLIAGSMDEGECDSPPSDGLLCPFKTPKDTFLGAFKPRLLAKYNQLSDSLIINKGRIYSDGTKIGLASCERIDQRSRPRTFDELCELGAIELVIDRNGIDQVGQDIKFGEVAKFTVTDSLVDGELVDSATCTKLFGRRADGAEWQPGCMKTVQTETPSKGSIRIDEQGNVTYVPNGNWHGADKFKLMVVTTTTRFNDPSNLYLEIPTTIVQEPSAGIENKTVDVGGGGGSLGFMSILGLLALMGLRRLKS